jgi:zinc/manganese transport system permease protein
LDTKSVFLIMLPAFCECLVLVGIHSYLGIHVIKRKVVFVDLAFAQIAALGTLIALLFGIPPHTPASFAFAICLTAMGAAVFSLSRFRQSKIPQEAIIGLVYAIAAAMTILVIDKAPHGAEHLKEILTGAILWVKWESILLAAAVYSAIGLFHYVFRSKFLLISEDPETAWASGVNVRMWDFLFYLSFGIVITLSVDVAGVLIVFVFLVAPAILVMILSDRLKVQLFLGWGLGVVVTTLGLFFAYVRDLSTGPAVIATYGVTMVIVTVAVYIARAAERGTALRNTVLVAASFGAAIGALYLAGGWLGETFREEHGFAEASSQRALEREEGGLAPEAVVAALEVGGPGAAALAIEFLKGDPPPFYREQVVRKVVELMPEDPGFAEDESLDSPANRRALERVLSHFGLRWEVRGGHEGHIEHKGHIEHQHRGHNKRAR